MAISSKIVWTLGGVLLMCSAFAEQKDGEMTTAPSIFGRPSLNDVSRRLEKVERKLDQVAEKKVSNVLGGNNPPAYGRPADTAFFIDLSFLYWKGFNHGWTAGYERRFPYQTSNGENFTNEKADQVSFDWGPGLRVGFGYCSEYDHWNVQGIYTWIRLTGSKDFISKDFGQYVTSAHGIQVTLAIFPSIAYPFSDGSYENLSAHWRLNHNIGDLQFGRDFYITKALALQPILGLRFAQLDQAMNAHFGQEILAPNYYFSYRISNDFWGIGPRIGVDGKWTFPHNVGITGLVTGSLLYGKTRITQHAYATGSFGSLEEIASETDYNYSIAPTVQLALGLDWGMCFNKDRVYWGLNLSWEFNYWWNQAHFDANRSFQFPIEIQGITLRSDFNF